jgi:hypothetical protein
MISVKVVNQVIQDHSLTKFNPIGGLKSQNFAEVYGDCFISGTVSSASSPLVPISAQNFSVPG